MTTSRSLPWKAWTVPTRRSSASSSSTVKRLQGRRLEGVGLGPERRDDADARSPRARSRRRSSSTTRVDLGLHHAGVGPGRRRSARRRTQSRDSVVGRPGRHLDPAAVEPAGDELDQVRVGAEVLVEDRAPGRRRRRRRRCCCGARRGGRPAPVRRRARGRSTTSPQAVVGEERDVAELLGVAHDHRPPAPEERRRGERLVDRRRLVEDHQVEEAGHRRQQVVDVGEGADPQRQGPGELVVGRAGPSWSRRAARPLRRAVARAATAGRVDRFSRSAERLSAASHAPERRAGPRRRRPRSSLPVGADLQAAAGDQVGGDREPNGPRRGSGCSSVERVTSGPAPAIGLEQRGAPCAGRRAGPTSRRPAAGRGLEQRARPRPRSVAGSNRPGATTRASSHRRPRAWPASARPAGGRRRRGVQPVPAARPRPLQVRLGARPRRPSLTGSSWPAARRAASASRRSFDPNTTGSGPGARSSRSSRASTVASDLAATSTRSPRASASQAMATTVCDLPVPGAPDTRVTGSVAAAADRLPLHRCQQVGRVDRAPPWPAAGGLPAAMSST